MCIHFCNVFSLRKTGDASTVFIPSSSFVLGLTAFDFAKYAVSHVWRFRVFSSDSILFFFAFIVEVVLQECST